MDASQTVVDGWDDYGYKVNGIYMRGSVLCFPSFTLLWDVQQIADVTHESLSPVLMFAPRVRVLLIGTGEEMQNVNPLLYGHFSKQGVAVEHMSSDNAMATFNVLNQEGRPAAAALLSRKPLPRDEACFYANGSADMVQGLAQQSQRSTYDVYDVP
ncbi:ndufaf3, partial [Symbiodinium sp. KB8]